MKLVNFRVRFAVRVAVAAAVLSLSTIVLMIAICREDRSMAEAEHVNTTSDLVVEYLHQMRFNNVAADNAMNAWTRSGESGLSPEALRLVNQNYRYGMAARKMVIQDSPHLLPALDAYLALVWKFRAEVLRGENATQPEAMALQGAFATIHREAWIWSVKWDARGGEAVWLMARFSIVSGLLTIVFACTMAFLMFKSVVRPVSALTVTMERLAAGERDIVIDEQDRFDEIGQMARAVRIFQQAAIDKARLEQEAATAAEKNEEERAHRDQARQTAAREQSQVVNALALALKKLSAGDLTCSLRAAFPKEYEPLRTDFNKALRSLADTVAQVSQNAEVVEEGVRRIDDAAGKLSIGAADQAESLEHTVVALKEVTNAVEFTANNVSEMTERLGSAREAAEVSADTAARAEASMAVVGDVSNEITQLTDLINEIAVRTNFLALNASIEANRAGHEGSGFAAVAAEVRALSMQVSKAGGQIRTLASFTQQRIEMASALVGEAKAAMTLNAEQVVSLDLVAQEIASSARQQSRRLIDVNSAIGAIDDVTQQTAEMAQLSAVAVLQVNTEAQRMTASVGRFQLK